MNDTVSPSQPKGNASSGLYDSSNEAVNTFTFRYPTVEVCTTSVSYIFSVFSTGFCINGKEAHCTNELAKLFVDMSTLP